MVIDTVKWRRSLVVNIDLVRLYRPSHAHHAQVVLELKPSLSTPDEVHVRRNQIRHQDLAHRKLQTSAVGGRQQEEFLLVRLVDVGRDTRRPLDDLACSQQVGKKSNASKGPCTNYTTPRYGHFLNTPPYRMSLTQLPTPPEII